MYSYLEYKSVSLLNNAIDFIMYHAPDSKTSLWVIVTMLLVHSSYLWFPHAESAFKCIIIIYYSLNCFHVQLLFCPLSTNWSSGNFLPQISHSRHWSYPFQLTWFWDVPWFFDHFQNGRGTWHIDKGESKNLFLCQYAYKPHSYGTLISCKQNNSFINLFDWKLIQSSAGWKKKL